MPLFQTAFCYKFSRFTQHIRKKERALRHAANRKLVKDFRWPNYRKSQNQKEVHKSEYKTEILELYGKNAHLITEISVDDVTMKKTKKRKKAHKNCDSGDQDVDSAPNLKKRKEDEDESSSEKDEANCNHDESSSDGSE